jgi:REP element-mobilizing transposase RayT
VNDFEFFTTETETRPTPTLGSATPAQLPASDPAPESKPARQLPASPTENQTTIANLPTPTANELAFSCVLIPRFPDHHLVGDITGELSKWLQQLCISYSWRLAAVVVRPGYLHWVMIVPMNSNPAQFMRLVRQMTSQKIFEDFPRFKRLNVSNDFWAPGNFVAPGNQLQTLENINTFITTTRQYQGIF